MNRPPSQQHAASTQPIEEINRTMPDTTNDIIRNARAMADNKVELVGVLVTKRGRLGEVRKQVRKQLEEAEREDLGAYQAAVAGGWTEAELKQIGLPKPDAKNARPTRTRARSRQRLTASTASATTAAPTPPRPTERDAASATA